MVKRYTRGVTKEESVIIIKKFSTCLFSRNRGDPTYESVE